MVVGKSENRGIKCRQLSCGPLTGTSRQLYSQGTRDRCQRVSKEAISHSSVHSITGVPWSNLIGSHIYRASLGCSGRHISAINTKLSPIFSTYVLCPPKVLSAPGPIHGVGTCSQGPKIFVALNILALLGAHPVHPLVIIQYVPSCLNSAGASFCPPSAMRT